MLKKLNQNKNILIFNFIVFKKVNKININLKLIFLNLLAEK